MQNARDFNFLRISIPESMIDSYFVGERRIARAFDHSASKLALQRG
jgi:hypothetical protein